MHDDTTRTPAHDPRSPWYRRPAWLGGAAVAIVAGTLATAAVLAPLSSGVGRASVAAGAGMPRTSLTVPAPGAGSGSYDDIGSSASGTASAAGSADAAPAAASSAQSTGVVLIDTVLGYANAEAAGTGMVIGANGLVLTNNHVVDGSTRITVTVASTGRTYDASVVGTDRTDDVAVLQLQGATGLQTVAIDHDGDAQVGAAATAVGNAEGGGRLLAAAGTIAALDSTVTTAAEGTTPSETLDGMIRLAADVVSGDSGGAVLDAQGEVIGMTTAASVGSGTTVGYAIPIDDALAIAQRIEAGDASTGVTIGYPAFLGVQIATAPTTTGTGRLGTRSGTGSATTAGATVGGVIVGTPAAKAGLIEGDVITAVDGTAIADASALSTAMAAHAPGQSVTIAWTDAAGTAHSATVTLVAGPAA